MNMPTESYVVLLHPFQAACPKVAACPLATPTVPQPFHRIHSADRHWIYGTGVRNFHNHPHRIGRKGKRESHLAKAYSSHNIVAQMKSNPL